MAEILENDLVGKVFNIEIDEDIELECMGVLAFEWKGRNFLAVNPIGEWFDEDEIIIFEIMSDGEALEIADISDEDEYDDIYETFEELFYAYTESVDEYEIVDEEFGAE